MTTGPMTSGPKTVGTPIEVVDLAGSPYERGRTLGATRSAAIGRCLDEWKASLRGVGDPETYLARFVAETGFEASVREHAPDLLDEVRGMAHGAGQPEHVMFAAQLMDEEWAYRGSIAEKCSSIGFRTSDGVVAGQNMDLGGYTDGHQVALRIAPHGDVPGALVFTLSSMIALMGVSTAPVSVSVNSLSQLPSAREGMPVAFLIRRLLQAGSLDEAVDVLASVPHATGQNYLLADDRGIRCFEGSSAGVREYEAPDAACVVHTNHPLAGWPEGTGEVGPSTVTRFDSLESRLGGAHASVEDGLAALASRDDPDFPVSIEYDPNRVPSAQTGMIGFTTGAMISHLRPGADIESWISAGPPSARGYTRVDLPRERGVVESVAALVSPEIPPVSPELSGSKPEIPGASRPSPPESPEKRTGGLG
jgi:hypothetical protein